jgi:hypothetical protein
VADERGGHAGGGHGPIFARFGASRSGDRRPDGSRLRARAGSERLAGAQSVIDTTAERARALADLADPDE